MTENGHLSFETAAQHAIVRVPIVDPRQRIHEVRDALVGQSYESASHIVVCEAGRFRGVLRIEDALSAPAESSVESVMDCGAPTVGPGVDQEVAAWRAVRHQEAALSVVDRSGQFRRHHPTTPIGRGPVIRTRGGPVSARWFPEDHLGGESDQ